MKKYLLLFLILFNALVLPAQKRQNRIAVFGSRAPVNATGLSNGTDVTETSRLKYVVNGDASELQVDYCNYARPASSLLTGYNDITIKVYLEYPSGTFTPLTIEGQSTYLLKVGGYVSTDRFPIELPDAAVFWIRTNYSVTSGQKWYKGWATSAAYSEGVVTGTDASGLGTITNSDSYCFGPLLIRGSTATTKASILLLGDSISAGFGDTGYTSTGYISGGGLFGRAFGASYNTMRFEASGDLLSNWQPTKRGLFFRAAWLCTHAIIQLGINDIRGSVTLATIQGYLINIGDNLLSRDIIIYATTITPTTTSTDNWATIANQTVFSYETVRVAYNTWLRDGAPIDVVTRAPLAVGSTTATTIRMGQSGHFLKGCFELADLAESARNSGKIAIATADGLHYTNVSYPTVVAGIFTTLFKTN